MAMDDTAMLHGLNILLNRLDEAETQNEAIEELLVGYLWKDSSGSVREDLEKMLRDKLTVDELKRLDVR